MPVINVEDLTDLDRAKMEVEQLKKEVKLEREKVRTLCIHKLTHKSMNNSLHNSTCKAKQIALTVIHRFWQTFSY